MNLGPGYNSSCSHQPATGKQAAGDADSRLSHRHKHRQHQDKDMRSSVGRRSATASQAPVRLSMGGGASGRRSATMIPSPDPPAPEEDQDDVQLVNGPASSSQTSSEATASPSKYPQRTRKRNRLIFHDELDTSLAPSSQGKGQRSSQKSLSSSQGSSARGGRAAAAAAAQDQKALEKRNAQRVGLSLRTLLKLPKAHKWVCYEWFYANIDEPLFLAENDFESYLKDSFPQLKTRMLRRSEWRKVRRLMGKPRRCSPAFFTEERAVLNNRRSKIRYLQQQKVVDIREFRDLPPNIPLSLVIGSRVTALLRRPSDGLFTGTLDAVDQTTGVYRITFDRPGIGSLDVPDYEVQSLLPAQFMPLQSFQSKVRARIPVCTPKYLELLESQVNQALHSDSDPLISGLASGGSHSPVRVKSESFSGHHQHHQQQQSHHHQQQTGHQSMQSQQHPASGVSGEEGGMLGGFPIKFLVLLVRLSKILAVKKRKVFELKSMNSEAEHMRSLGRCLPHEFQKHYANTILDLEKLNNDLNDYLKSVSQYTADLCPEGSTTALSGQTELLKAKFLEEGKELAERSLASHAVGCGDKSEKAIDMVSHLLSLLLHLRGFADAQEVSSFELKSLTDSLQSVKDKVLPENKNLFETQVEINVNHIQSSLSHLGNLGAFSESVDACDNTPFL